MPGVHAIDLRHCRGFGQRRRLRRPRRPRPCLRHPQQDADRKERWRTSYPSPMRCCARRSPKTGSCIAAIIRAGAIARSSRSTRPTSKNLQLVWSRVMEPGLERDHAHRPRRHHVSGQSQRRDPGDRRDHRRNHLGISPSAAAPGVVSRHLGSAQAHYLALWRLRHLRHLEQ